MLCWLFGLLVLLLLVLGAGQRAEQNRIPRARGGLRLPHLPHAQVGACACRPLHARIPHRAEPVADAACLPGQAHLNLLGLAPHFFLSSSPHFFLPPLHCCSLAYLHHLVKANEPLAASLLAIHNLHHMNQMTAELRQKIMNDEV